MAEFDMWGPAQSGARLANEDAQRFQLNNIAIQQGKQNLVMNQMKMLNAIAQQKQQAQTQQIIQRDSGKTLYETGADLIQSGNIVQGLDMLSKAAEIEDKQSVAIRNQAQASMDKTKGSAELLAAFASMTASSNSQDDYNRGVQTLEQATGQKLPDNLRNATWSPEMKKSLSELGSSWKDRMMGENERQRTILDAQNKGSEERLRNIQMIKEEALAREANARADSIIKNGGKSGASSVIPTSDTKAAEDMIRADFPDALDDATTRSAAHYVASRAQELLRKNPGLDRDTALYQAYSAAKSSGDIQPNTSGGLFSEPTGVKLNRNQFPGAPAIGTISQGYKFKGGDPSDKNSWEKQ